MAKEDRQHKDEPVDIFEDLLGNTAVPDILFASFNLNVPEDFDVADFLADLVENTSKECALIRDAVKESKDERMRKVFDTYSTDQRKSILNNEYRSALVSLSKLPSAGGSVLVPANLTPQNWNGNRYQGTGCINLQMKMATHPDWLPVFATSDQIKAIGVAKKMDATVNSVVCKFGDDGQHFRHVAWNVEDLNFDRKYPRHLIAFRELFKGMSEFPVTKAGMDLVMQDGRGRSVEDVVRDLVRATDTPGQRPRFSSSNIPATERMLLKNLVEDLAVMSICSRLRAPSHVRLASLMAFQEKRFTIAYPFYSAMCFAGKITLDLDKKLSLFNRRGVNMDTVTNSVNKEIQKELMVKTGIKKR